MGVVAMMKSVVGAGDDVGLLTGEIESTRAKGIAASAELERLEQARLVAEDYDAAKVIEARIDRVRFEVEKLAAALPLLENRLSIARAARPSARKAVRPSADHQSFPPTPQSCGAP